MTVSYPDLKKYCEESSVLSRAVIDELLIHYAARKENLVPLMEVQLKKYKKVVRELPEQYINILKSEYIAHRIFREEGFISRYLNHPEIRNLPELQYRFLEVQHRHPWRFSFAEVRQNPENSFFEMEDIITGGQYLLYSPGMQTTINEYTPRIWFNLIGDNGKCWQTYGLIIPFKSFTEDDIFFFATELNPNIENGEMLMKEVENNPFPFFMLLFSSGTPVIMHKGHEMLICASTDIVENFVTEKLSGEFTSEWNKHIYRFTHHKFGAFPHFATAYYHEQKRELLRSAMTETGFQELSKAIAKAGFAINADADILVSPGMFTAAERILSKKIRLDPYEKLFSQRRDLNESENLKQINHFLQLALPFYNEQKEIDIKQLAQEAGIDEETAASVWENLKKSADNAKKTTR